ncbi:methyl-accepting chemotaxis protein [Haloplanus pelagicus]|uniref:methyl-accepting chemotaxis protein n=1 Tax=Haloplanus pelagicus TaxID=2949995 RepID=UPI0020400006|nr:methyl-accepting chemotaxis protein [Haloplanus sp. HW8-1]
MDRTPDSQGSQPSVAGPRPERIRTDGGRAEANADAVTIESTESEETGATDGADAGRAVELNVDDDVLIDGVGMPVFILDGSGAIAAWNHSIEEFSGNGDDVAIGSTKPSTVFYPDGREREMLAQTVLESPESADEREGVELEDESLSLYATDETVTDRRGETRHFRHTSMPLNEEGEFVAVIQAIRDRTSEVKRQEAVADLVDEIRGTLHDLADGRLDSRASFDTDDRVVDDRLAEVITELNRTAEEFESLASEVDDETQSLADAIDRTATAAVDIAENVEDQNGLLQEGAEEMQSFSASIEEVAATTDEVESAADEARTAASDGLDASADAREATESVVDVSEELVEDVTALGDRMDDIEAVVEVISEVADRTNLLALNANIEAARAGEDGDGFAVVAEEVKSLAEQTHDHTEEITDDIQTLQTQTDETVEAATRSVDRIEEASQQIDGVLETFEEIAETIDRLADGVAEVSRTADDQAATGEELTATIETLRDRAEETAAAADRIVAAANEADEVIDDLSRSVDELRASDGQVAADRR